MYVNCLSGCFSIHHSLIMVPGCGTALRAEVACMLQWLARIGVLKESQDVALWRDWLLDGLFRQVAHLQPRTDNKQQVCVCVCWG